MGGGSVKFGGFQWLARFDGQWWQEDSSRGGRRKEEGGGFKCVGIFEIDFYLAPKFHQGVHES